MILLVKTDYTGKMLLSIQDTITQKVFFAIILVLKEREFITSTNDKIL